MFNLNYEKFTVVFIALSFVVGRTVFAADETPQIDNNQVAPPWSVTPLKSGELPIVYLSEWKKAKNRTKCALLVLSGAEKEPQIKVRKANFSGGWAVAYDTPKVRSAFGIAGSGIDIEPLNTVHTFPNVISWSDGSVISYGLEGGAGPGYLAYLTVSGQTCLYNVWSTRGKAHLEQLILTLRLVQVMNQ